MKDVSQRQITRYSDNEPLANSLPPKSNLSIVKGPETDPLLVETISEFFSRTVQAFGDRPAAVFIEDGVRWTWSELAERVDQVAKGLIALGVEKGDRVGIWAANCPEWILTQFAAAQVGAILVNLNPANKQEELKYAIKQVGMKVLVAAPKYGRDDCLETIKSILPELDQATPGSLNSRLLPSLRAVVHLGENEQAGMLSFSQLIREGDTVGDQVLTQRSSENNFRDPIDIQFTSGTTGKPKAATLTHYNVINNAKFVSQAMRLTEQDKLCIPVPLFHCFGMVMSVLACVHSGSCMVFPSRRFNEEKVLEAISNERCTAVHGVPAMFIAELNHANFAKYDLSSLRTGIMAGAPCPIDIMKRVAKDMHIPEITIAYGMTETSPVSFQTMVTDPIERRVSSVGRVVPHVEVKIVDDNGEIVPLGTAGELCTRGYSVMNGYWGDEEKTREAIQDGWMRTGDLATLDSEGYCNIVGRKKDMIDCGGEKFFPREIEDILRTHPDVADVQVFGIPSKLRGENICAWIVPKANTDITPTKLRDYFGSQYDSNKFPRFIELVDSFPQTVSGKPKKYEMRAEMVQKLGLTENKTA